MHNHPFRKSLGLLVLYAVFIVGIFVIQFRSDSIIRKTIRSMRVTLAETENTNQQLTLKNQMQLTYNGAIFSFDEASPATYALKGKVGLKNATLDSFEQPDDSTFKFNFKEGISLLFTVTEDEDSHSLTVSANLPEDIETVSLNLAPYAGYSVTEQKAKQTIFTGKNDSYSLMAHQFMNGRITFTRNGHSARYAIINEQEEFTLDRIDGIAMATNESWKKTAAELSSTIISEFSRQLQNNASFASNIPEQTAVAYVAVMAQAGRYNEAVSAVPESFTKSTRRTYVSAPFFGSMAAMAPTLVMQTDLFNNMIERANTEKTLDIFTMDNIAQYMLTQFPRSDVLALAAMPASLTEINLTASQAAGILRSYAVFKKANSPMAESLLPVLELCEKKILEIISLDGEKILLTENDAPLSVIAAATVGDAFVTYGIATDRVDVESCGYLILNSYIADLQALDLRTLSELYPVVIHSNTYYPHFALLHEGTSNVWAWTIAKSAGYSRDENQTIELDIEFPIGLSHYLFVGGITPFRRVQIYNMNFRTDPQFEIYNSSGYVYRSATKTLLLKQRHREQHEIVRLFYQDIEETPSESGTETE